MMLHLFSTFFYFMFLFQLDYSDYTQEIDGSDLSLDMVLISGGKFNMGESLRDNTEVSSFWISKYEITWEIYNLFMEHEISNDQKFKVGDELISLDGISKPTTPYTDMTFGMGYEGYPAVNMTHYSATKFCQWLSINTGYYYRLPTEAEWEFASRAGSRKDNYFDDEVSVIDDYAWHKENSGGKYQKVGQKKPNGWGLYDMLGNVSEWVADSYEERIFKPRGIRKNPFVYDESKYPKVYRGGSWKDKPENLSSSKRYFSDRSLQKRDPQIPKSLWWNTDAPFIGFRVVRVDEISKSSLRKKFWNNLNFIIN